MDTSAYHQSLGISPVRPSTKAYAQTTPCTPLDLHICSYFLDMVQRLYKQTELYSLRQITPTENSTHGYTIGEMDNVRNDNIPLGCQPGHQHHSS